jgi:hypothetical protein
MFGVIPHLTIFRVEGTVSNQNLLEVVYLPCIVVVDVLWEYPPTPIKSSFSMGGGGNDNGIFIEKKGMNFSACCCC